VFASTRLGVAAAFDLDMPALRRFELDFSIKYWHFDIAVEKIPGILRKISFIQIPSIQRIDVTFLMNEKEVDERRRLNAVLDTIRHPWVGPDTKVFGWIEREFKGRVARSDISMF
jgi:hypothetical protein